MIRNIVFDMGNVLMRWDPDSFPREFFPDAEDCRAAGARLFGGAEWPALDAGAMEEDEAIARVLRDLPERLRPGTARLFWEWHLHFPPIPEMNALARELKGRGYRVYLLSNASTRFAAYREAIPCHDCFDGEVVSAFVRQVKPNPEIYETLLTRYGLSAEECFFIDDMPANIAAAQDAGMAGFVYGGEVGALRRALRGAGVDA
ncbi:HAD family phosphatase [uncultured Anaerotruncus sp.]|uniref:HAD family hydrolase n=1 Tax=uncultured Anaerotruncus sp. TaxID=905011 RepID=UPI00280AE86E|nr:HAD family phosphatase [uncultured Anaerotruncus sp.]